MLHSGENSSKQCHDGSLLDRVCPCHVTIMAWRGRFALSCSLSGTSTSSRTVAAVLAWRAIGHVQTLEPPTFLASKESIWHGQCHGLVRQKADPTRYQAVFAANPHGSCRGQDAERRQVRLSPLPRQYLRGWNVSLCVPML